LTRSSIDSRIVDPELNHRYYDDESIYSNATGLALRDSWQSAATSSTAREYVENLEDITPNSNPTYYSQQQRSSPFSSNVPVPTLIVSSPNDLVETTEYTRAGRMPIMGPTGSNFSRPVRPALSSTPEDEQQKRRVLERNVRRAPSPSATHRTPGFHDQHQTQSNQGDRMLFPHSKAGERAKSPIPTVGSIRSDTRSPSPNRGQVISSYAPPSQQVPLMIPVRSLSPATHRPPAAPLSLLKRPPSLRMGSPVSLYSGYSFYQLDSTSPSPTREELHDRLSAHSSSGQVVQSSPAQLSPPPDLSPTLDSDIPTPQDYLQQGIQHHEANRLKESAICFEKSAKESGGCGIGMLMWGLALRHGWGCEKNEKFAFKWLTRAAESAVEDLENARAGGGIDSNAVQVRVTHPVSNHSQSYVVRRQNLSLLSMKLDSASSRDGV
jgi:hypothetical protein